MPSGLSEAQLIDRVHRLEAQLAAVYARLGMDYDDGSGGLPPDVVDMARAGNRMRAAKLYAERTGCDFIEAQRVVSRIQMALDEVALINRIRRLEEQVALLSRQAGVAWDDGSGGIPPSVVSLARAGKKIEAIKEYRELTGVGLAEAKDVVDRL